jgi:hypothetical protein
MSDHAITSGVSIFLAIIGVAIVALIVSAQSKTTTVVGAGGSALKQAICVALSPVTGGGNCGNLTPSVTSTINFGSV